jgi:hypothetical protein
MAYRLMILLMTCPSCRVPSLSRHNSPSCRRTGYLRRSAGIPPHILSFPPGSLRAPIGGSRRHNESRNCYLPSPWTVRALYTWFRDPGDRAMCSTAVGSPIQNDRVISFPCLPKRASTSPLVHGLTSGYAPGLGCYGRRPQIY